MSETKDQGVWIAQDVFSSGCPGPGFTIHQDENEATEEANRRDAIPLFVHPCSTCGSLIGLDNAPIQGGCNDCRA